MNETSASRSSASLATSEYGYLVFTCSKYFSATSQSCSRIDWLPALRSASPVPLYSGSLFSPVVAAKKDLQPDRLKATAAASSRCLIGAAPYRPGRAESRPSAHAKLGREPLDLEIVVPALALLGGA